MPEQRFDRPAPTETLGAENGVGRLRRRLELPRFKGFHPCPRRCGRIVVQQQRLGVAGPFGLALHQAEIHPARGHELGMGAGLGDAAAVQGEDTVGADYTGQTMGENQRGPPFHQPIERVLDDRFVFRIDR